MTDEVAKLAIEITNALHRNSLNEAFKKSSKSKQDVIEPIIRTALAAKDAELAEHVQYIKEVDERRRLAVASANANIAAKDADIERLREERDERIELTEWVRQSKDEPVAYLVFCYNSNPYDYQYFGELDEAESFAKEQSDKHFDEHGEEKPWDVFPLYAGPEIKDEGESHAG